MMPVYIKLFNKVLGIEEVPEYWLVGLILPIFKKGVAKLIVIIIEFFTSILKEGFYIFCENNDTLKKIQTGFRKCYNTMNNFFVLKHIIDLFISKSINYTVVLGTLPKHLIQYGGMVSGINVSV